jgi:hypothetical protein
VRGDTAPNRNNSTCRRSDRLDLRSARSPRADRAGAWNDAIAALEKSEAEFPGRFTAVNRFSLAMAYGRLGEKEKGREWYEKAVPSVETASQPTGRELALFRSEASHLLGIPDPKRPSKGDD